MDANCVTGRALVTGGAGVVVLVMFPVAEVLRSYSGSSGSIVSNNGVVELMITRGDESGAKICRLSVRSAATANASLCLSTGAHTIGYTWPSLVMT